MKITADYHTHTIYSHGKGTTRENVKVAKEKGLRQIAITDHGFNHKFFGVRRKDLPIMRREIEKAKEDYGIEVLLGVEANLISAEGHIDVLEKDEEKLDIILMGFHKMVFASSIKDRFKLFMANSFARMFGHSTEAILKNTNAYIKALKNNKIDVITHLGYAMRVDSVKIAKACMETNTYLELNGKRIKFRDDEMKAIIATGVKFIINSDAHRTHRIGECPLGIKFALKHNIPESQLANINKVPKFKNHR
jgi:putative hydrolase